jgi:PAS domain-containing protein
MAIAWGPDLRMLYNDRYAALLAAGHPRALGAPACEVFAACWDVTGPLFAQVLGGEPVALEDWYLPLFRNGRLEHGWFNLSCSPVRDESGGVAGAMVIVTEITRQVDAERDLAAMTRACAIEAERATAATRDLEAQRRSLYQLFEQVPAGIAVVRGDDLVFEMANRRYLATAGLRNDVIGRRAFDVLPHLRGRGFEQIVAQVRRTGEVCVVREMEIAGRWWAFVIAPIRTERGPGAIDRIMTFSYEVTDQVVVRRRAEAGADLHT